MYACQCPSRSLAWRARAVPCCGTAGRHALSCAARHAAAKNKGAQARIAHRAVTAPLRMCIPRSAASRVLADGPVATELHQVVLPVWPDAECERSLPEGLYLSPQMLCAGVSDGGRDTCSGDSGGPLIWHSAGTNASAAAPSSDAIAAARAIDASSLPAASVLLLGISSWGLGCALPDRPGVYVRIATYRDWLVDAAGLRELALPPNQPPSTPRSPPSSPPLPPSPPPPPSPPSPPSPPPAMRNEGLDCWVGCAYSQGACPTFCGERGACCRAGFAYAPPECAYGALGCDGQHCCTRVPPPPPRPPPAWPPHSLLVAAPDDVWPSEWFGNFSTPDYASVRPAVWTESGVRAGYDFGLPPFTIASPRGLLTLQRSFLQLPDPPTIAASLPRLQFEATPVFCMCECLPDEEWGRGGSGGGERDVGRGWSGAEWAGGLTTALACPRLALTAPLARRIPPLPAPNAPGAPSAEPAHRVSPRAWLRRDRLALA